jgi:hypothetical protein
MRASFRNHLGTVNEMAPLPESIRAAREAACAGCEWNMEPTWTACEHPGCLICRGKQRRSGGLKAMLQIASYLCPCRHF